MSRRVTTEGSTAPVVVHQIQRMAIAANLSPCGSHTFRRRTGRPTDNQVECRVRAVLASERGPEVIEVVVRGRDYPTVPLDRAYIRSGRL